MIRRSWKSGKFHDMYGTSRSIRYIPLPLALLLPNALESYFFGTVAEPIGEALVFAWPQPTG
jgi:hypothetical protein